MDEDAGSWRADFRSLDRAERAREIVLEKLPQATTTGPSTESDPGFVVRLIVIVALASIIGTAVGAAIGVLLIAAGIAPDTTESLVLQVVTWAIFWHLLIGMVAGYALLADRSDREWRPGRKASLAVTAAGARAGEIEGILRDAGATRVVSEGPRVS